jgi:iron-sulfur cluster repair protein YtfE (RIC family)
MHRAESLQPLSRQHKAALMTCLLIRKGVSRQAPVAVMTDFFLHSWEKEIAPHMVEEENKLIPLLNQFDQGKPFAQTILRDHELIRNSMEHLRMENVNTRLLADLADMLEQHVRYEERIVFQSMQKFIPPRSLAAISINENHQQPVCDNYPVHFWE